MAQYLFFLITSLLSSSKIEVARSDDQAQFLNFMNKSLFGNLLSDCDVNGSQPVCNYKRIGCNDHGSVIKIDVSGWSLSGCFPEDVCSYLPELHILGLGNNNLHGKFPDGITNCSFHEVLNISSIYLTGTLPNLSPLISLKSLDLSYNYFTAEFPLSVTNLTNLELLDFNENAGFDLWQLPDNFSRLTKLKYVVLTTCMVQGRIPASIGLMTSLVDLELSGNLLTGYIPAKFWIAQKPAVTGDWTKNSCVIRLKVHAKVLKYIYI